MTRADLEALAVRCEDCRFAKINWRKGDLYERGYSFPSSSKTEERLTTSVHCRINPPVAAQFSDGSDGWPWVSGDDWCAKFEPRSHSGAGERG